MTIFAKVVVILASIWPICIKSNESTNDTLSYVHDHNFLFISGWPQSGTSLMQMMFTVAPQTSTMVRKCNEMIPGNKCIDWNFEGQWIVKFGMAKTEGYYASALLNSGAMCKLHVLDNTRSTNPDVTQLRDEDLLNHLQKVENGIYIMNETERTSAQRNVLQTWGQFWNLDMPLLVEKSPHLMLKTKQLRSIYTGAKSVKFIAVIKHPATLNCALPRNTNWVTRIVTKEEKKKLNPKTPEAPGRGHRKDITEVPLTIAELENNARFFINFMTHQMNGTGRKCSLGWLEAMGELREDLQGHTDVKIVRYDDFENPYPACQSIFRFVHDSSTSSSYLAAEDYICRNHFIPHRAPDRIERNPSERQQGEKKKKRRSQEKRKKEKKDKEKRPQEKKTPDKGSRENVAEENGSPDPENKRPRNGNVQKPLNQKPSKRKRKLLGRNGDMEDSPYESGYLVENDESGDDGYLHSELDLENPIDNSENSVHGGEIIDEKHIGKYSEKYAGELVGESEGYEAELGELEVADEAEENRRDRRRLRLKWSTGPQIERHETLEFIPSVLSSSIHSRLEGYHSAYKRLPHDLQVQLDKINKRLKLYGYSLDKGRELWYKHSNSTFDPWTNVENNLSE